MGSRAADELGGDPISVAIEPVTREPVAKPDDPDMVALANARGPSG